MERKTLWTEQDLVNLKGLAESSRMEFKESRLLEQSKEKVAEVLSKEASAFANSEGGVIIVGIKERREGKSRVADDLDDGIDPTVVSPQWLQQLVQANLSPYLPGLRLYPVKLSGPRQGRIGIVIDVPSGSTAYQASDRRYYGRAEYECIPLQDHEVRLRIMRGRVAAARMEVGKVECIPYGKALIFYFDLILVNVGEITITDLLLSLQVESNVRLLAPVGDQIPGSSPLTYRLREGLGRHDEREEGGFSPLADVNYKVFPEQRVQFPRGRWQVSDVGEESISQATLSFSWTLYLDNSPPTKGLLNLMEEFRNAPRYSGPSN